MSNKGKGIVCIVASALGFAVMAACVRLCDDFGAPVSSFQKSFFRNALAFAVALVVFVQESRVRKTGTGPAARTPPLGPVPARTWLLLVLRSVFGTVGIFANFYALGRISIAEGQTLNKTAPFFTVLFAWLFLRERVSRKAVGKLLLAFGGVLLIAKPGFAGEAAFPLLMGLLGGIAAGAAYTALRALGKEHLSSAFIILFFSAFSCLAAVPFMLRRFDAMTAAQVLILLGAGGGAALGQFGITLAYRFAAPRDIAVYDYTNILFTAALGLALFGQIPDLWSVAGVVLILAAALKRG